jgi:anaerobic ribonucleoside-triphosphate reductase
LNDASSLDGSIQLMNLIGNIDRLLFVDNSIVVVDRQLLKVAAQEGCNYFTFNIPNTICNDCGKIDKRYLKKCTHCHSEDVDYLTRIIGYMKRVSNFSAARQKEASKRYYATF